MAGKQEDQSAKVTIDYSNTPVVYANVAEIGVTGEEFIFKFALRTTATEAIGAIQVITSVPHAKRLLIALAQSIERYEKRFGEINPEPGIAIKKDE